MRGHGSIAWIGTLALVIGLVACTDSEPTSTADISEVPSAEPVEWPAPDDPMQLTVDAGLEPEVREQLKYHVHAHLDVFVDGEPVTVPAGIGIDIDNPGVQKFNEGGDVGYGGIEGCDEPCISPLHTHDVSGLLHTESATKAENTLGQFFTEWDLRLDEDCVATYCRPDDDIAIYVDGDVYDGDPADIALSDQREIAIVIGSPPAEIPGVDDSSAA